MIRSLVVVVLTAVGVASIVSCGGTDLVVDDRTDDDPSDEDTDGDSGDTGPIAPIAPQLNIQVYDVTSTTMLIRWSHEAPEGCCTYKVYYSGSQTGPFTFVGEVTEFPRITGLTPETFYWVYVSAVRDGLESSPSFTRSVFTKPGQASNFHVERIGGGGVIVAWDPVDGASGFNVYRSAPGSTEVSETSPSVHVGGDATSAVVDGLESSSTYAFKMNVEKGVFRLGDLSEATSATTGGPVTVAGFTPDHGVSTQQVTVTGADFGTVIADVTLIFEGEAGPGDERVAVPSALSDGSLTVAVPAGAKTGPLSVRRFLYGKTTSATSYEVGPIFAPTRLVQGGGSSERIVSIHAASPTRALAGRLDGTLLRTTMGAAFVELDYASALSAALDCAGDPGDAGSDASLDSIQCVADDCLVARANTCNAIRIADTFDASPVLTVKRIGPATGAAIGPTRLLACGNSTDAAGCVSLRSDGGGVTMAYTADFTTTDFTATTTTPPLTGYANLRGRPDSNTFILFGLDAMFLGTLPFSDPFDDFTASPAISAGGDCTTGANGPYCVVALGDTGLEQGAAGSGPVSGVALTAVVDVTAARFHDAQCLTHRNCIAVGGLDIGLPTEAGILAQTFDGVRWFYRPVGDRELRVVSCVTDRCFIGDRDGGIWRADAP